MPGRAATAGGGYDVAGHAGVARESMPLPGATRVRSDTPAAPGALLPPGAAAWDAP
jgi:hypothetical protein